MKTFRIIVEFKNAPDEFPMAAARAMAVQALERHENWPDVCEDDSEHLYQIHEIRKQEFNS